MTIEAPKLDDRSFHELVSEARARIQRECPEWSDLSPSDPGIVLVELFAYLTEVMLYRINRIPEKAYVELLRLMGLVRKPPSAAGTELTLSLARPADRALTIPDGTQVAVSRASGGEPAAVFATSRPVDIAAGATEARVRAHHCEWVTEALGESDGRAGQWFRVTRPPIVSPLEGTPTLVVGVALADDEEHGNWPAREHGGRAYRLWEEVESFADLDATAPVYLADRNGGLIRFAPALRSEDVEQRLSDAPTALAAIPTQGREIRIWYRRGGGASGNVPARALGVFKSPVPPGLTVTNPEPATGGSDAESIEHALLRGPQQLHSLERIVTARDYELWAVRSSGAVQRARAFTQSELWRHGRPGTVEVTAVPTLPDDAVGPDGRVAVERIEAQQRAAAERLPELQRSLTARQPLGTQCVVRWAHIKQVTVHIRVGVYRAEDLSAVRTRLLQRLYSAIDPIGGRGQPGWAFGVALRASHVFELALAEPGVRWVDHVRLRVDHVPAGSIQALERDAFQPRTWYAGSGPDLFRSENDGAGWERMARIERGAVTRVRAHPEVPGVVAVLSVASASNGQPASSFLTLSRDCGETCHQRNGSAWQIRDLAWTVRRDGTPYLLLAGDQGLHGLAFEPGAQIEPIPMHGTPLALTSVVAGRDAAGRRNVAVAAQEQGGVWLSIKNGEANTFRALGLENLSVRRLALQRVDANTFLWAAVGDFSRQADAKGCRRWRLLGAENPPEAWQNLDEAWDGGSCTDLAFDGEAVFAASALKGVLRLDGRRWRAPGLECGLPRDEARLALEAVHVVAVAGGGASALVMAGGPRGVYRSADAGLRYETCSGNEFDERVTVPRTWLVCSGQHELEVVYEDEARDD